MHAFDVLLGNAPALEAKFGFYQRLLARDEAEASEVIEEYLDENGVEKLVEQIFVPTFRQVRDDIQREELNREDLEMIARSASSIMKAQRRNFKSNRVPPRSA